MAGKLSFSVAINLLTENFKKGANYIKSSFRSIQMQAMSLMGALGAGVGFGQMVSSMIEVSRESSRVQTALKNVSGSAEQLAGNQRFLIELSNKYGIYINDLTANFSKFTSAASSANMQISDQYKIFQALSKASIAYGMSQDQSNRMFVAVTQMMSKGTIAAEELRGQLGEQLPVAMGIMAKAAGTDVEGLQKMMKAGKLTADVLIPFADELEKSLGNIDTKSLESSMNRLKNIFKNFVDNAGVQAAYSKIIESTGKLLSWLMSNFQTVSFWFVNIIYTIIITKGLRLISAYYDQLGREAYKSFAKQSVAAGMSMTQVKAAFTGGTKAVNIFKFAVKSAMKAFLPMAAISAIVAIVQKIIGAQKEQKRLNAITKDYEDGLKSASKNDMNIQDLKSAQKIFNDTNRTIGERNTALKNINTILGTNFAIDADAVGINQQINNKIAERLPLLEKQAELNYLIDQKLRASEGMAPLRTQIDSYNEQIKSNIDNGVKPRSFLGIFKNEAQKVLDKRAPLINEFVKLNMVFDDATNRINKLSTEIDKLSGNKKGGGGDKGGGNVDGDSGGGSTPTSSKPKTDLEQAEEEYVKSLVSLKKQKDNQVITTEEYNALYDDINETAYKQLGSLLDLDQAQKNTLFQLAKAAVANKLVNTSLIEFNKAQTDYTKSVEQLDKLKSLGVLTETEYVDELRNLINSTINGVVAIDGIGSAADEFINNLKTKGTALPQKPDVSKWDYKSPFEKIGLTDQEIMQIDLDQAKQELSKLQDIASNTIDDMSTELDQKLAEAIDLEKALKLNEIKTKIGELSKELNSGIYQSVKDIGGAAQSIYQAFKSLADVMQDEDATGLDKFFEFFSFLTGTIDTVMNVVNGIQKITEVTKKLGKAKEDETKINAISAGVKIAETAAVVGANEVEKKSTEALVATYTKLMLAKTTSAFASMGLVGMPLATLQSATYLALINSASNLQKFAAGGIVKGNSTFGDKILVRANAGEMLLNHNQQATLFNMLNGSGSGGSKQRVEFVIEGKELKGVLDNYNKIKNKVK